MTNARPTRNLAADELADMGKRAGWVLDETGMAKSGYAPRKRKLAEWVVALVARVTDLEARAASWQASCEAARQDFENIYADREAYIANAAGNARRAAAAEAQVAALTSREVTQPLVDAAFEWKDRALAAEAALAEANKRIEELEAR